MWPALVLVWLSSLSLFGSQVASEKPAGPLASNKTQDVLVKKNASVHTDDKTLGKTTTVTRVPVMSTQGNLAVNLTITQVLAETANRTNMSTAAPEEGMTDGLASRAPLSPVSTSTRQTPSTATARAPPLSTPPAGRPRSSTLPGAATVTAEAIQAPATAATGTGHPSSTLSPAGRTPPRSAASPATPTSSQAQGPTTQVSSSPPGFNTTAWSTPTPHTTPEPATTRPETPVSSTVVTTTQVRAEEPTASTVPVPHTSPTPMVETMSLSPATQPSPSSHTQGAGGPGSPPTPEQGKTKTTPGAASSGPTPTDMCPLSTQGQYLVVTTEPLAPSLVNKTFLLAVLVLGVTLFVTVLVLFALQAYESHRKKDYTQVDYLINGMYADSEM